jgi:DNA-binding MarR family transcriptional regulator
MAEITAERAARASVDLGQALGAVLRTYLDGARDVVSGLPGGPRGYQVMSVASGDECSNQAAIAKMLGLDRTVMTYLVDDLEDAGLVERRPDPADRRARRVVLTAKGRRTLTSASARILDVERSTLGPLDDTEAAMFRDLLMKVVADAPLDPTDPCTEASDVPSC